MWRRFASVFRSIEFGQGAGRAATLVVLLLHGGPAIAGNPAVVDGLARVDDGGRLVIDGQTVALAGIDVPTMGRVCRRSLSPVRCGPPAVLVLDGLVRGFVRCEITGARGARLPEGRCTMAARRLLDERIDLAVELLRQGWAFTRPNAPPLYRSLERIARRRGIGAWADAAVQIH